MQVQAADIGWKHCGNYIAFPYKCVDNFSSAIHFSAVIPVNLPEMNDVLSKVPHYVSTLMVKMEEIRKIVWIYQLSPDFTVSIL